MEDAVLYGGKVTGILAPVGRCTGADPLATSPVPTATPERPVETDGADPHASGTAFSVTLNDITTVTKTL